MGALQLLSDIPQQSLRSSVWVLGAPALLAGCDSLWPGAGQEGLGGPLSRTRDPRVAPCWAAAETDGNHFFALSSPSKWKRDGCEFPRSHPSNSKCLNNGILFEIANFRPETWGLLCGFFVISTPSQGFRLTECWGLRSVLFHLGHIIFMAHAFYSSSGISPVTWMTCPTRPPCLVPEVFW